MALLCPGVKRRAREALFPEIRDEMSDFPRMIPCSLYGERKGPSLERVSVCRLLRAARVQEAGSGMAGRKGSAEPLIGSKAALMISLRPTCCVNWSADSRIPASGRSSR